MASNHIAVFQSAHITRLFHHVTLSHLGVDALRMFDHTHRLCVGSPDISIAGVPLLPAHRTRLPPQSGISVGCWPVRTLQEPQCTTVARNRSRTRAPGTGRLSIRHGNQASRQNYGHMISTVSRRILTPGWYCRLVQSRGTRDLCPPRETVSVFPPPSTRQLTMPFGRRCGPADSRFDERLTRPSRDASEPGLNQST